MNDENDLKNIVNFISLQEKVKKSDTKRQEPDTEEENDDDNINLDPIANYAMSAPDEMPSMSGIQPSLPSGDVAKRQLTFGQTPKPVASALPTGNALSRFSSAMSQSDMQNLYFGTGVQSVRNRAPGQNMMAQTQGTPAFSIRDMVTRGQLSRMPIAASYDPFLNNKKEELSENTKMMRSKVIRILNKEPHKTEINNMRKQISGE